MSLEAYKIVFAIENTTKPTCPFLKGIHPKFCRNGNWYGDAVHIIMRIFLLLIFSCFSFVQIQAQQSYADSLKNEFLYAKEDSAPKTVMALYRLACVLFPAIS